MGSFHLLPFCQTKVWHVHNITQLPLHSLPVGAKALHLPIMKSPFLADLHQHITRILSLHLIAMESPPLVNLPILKVHHRSCHVVLVIFNPQLSPLAIDRRPCPSIAASINPREVAKSLLVLGTWTRMVSLSMIPNLRCQAPGSQAREVGPTQRPRANNVHKMNLMKKGMTLAGRGSQNIVAPGGRCYQVCTSKDLFHWRLRYTPYLDSIPLRLGFNSDIMMLCLLSFVLAFNPAEIVFTWYAHQINATYYTACVTKENVIHCCATSYIVWVSWSSQQAIHTK